MAKNILIELDAETAARLEAAAPAKSRKRAEFIRAAIRKAVWEFEERQTAEAYRRQPDSEDHVYVDATAWEAKPGKRRSTKR